MKPKGSIYGPARRSVTVAGWWDVTYKKPNGELWTISSATRACAMRAAREAVRAADRESAAKVPA